jgi:smad nuclear-interacting protein 1
LRDNPPHRHESVKRSRSPEPWGSHQHDLAHNEANPRSASPPKEKQKPNYGLSGALAAVTNMKNGTVLKYNEPPEAKKTKGWRIYIFKDGKEVDVLELGGQSSFLVGRERMVTPSGSTDGEVADIPVDHTSCSKQHAVIQFRQVSSKNEFGDVSRVIKPYLIDLDSTNGSMLNGEKIDPRRYVEIRTEDMVKFGESTREYVFIKDPSA